MYDIQDTSLLVTILQGNTIHTTPACKKYRSLVNLTPGRSLAKKYTDYSDVFEQIVKNRKYCVSRLALQYAKPNTQFVILAAGIDALSLYLASKRHDIVLFETDINLMKEKTKLLYKSSPKLSKLIHCITADIAKPKLFHKKLVQHGFDPTLPTVIVAEGISYYITKNIFWNTIKTLTHPKLENKLIFEHSIPVRYVHPSTRYLLRFGFGTITKNVDVQPLTYYSHHTINAEVKKIGGNVINHHTMKSIEKCRFGKNVKFTHNNDIGIEICSATI